MYDSDGSTSDEEVPLVIHLIAGCIAGAIEATATWPFEYIKTQLQLHARPKNAAMCSLSDMPVISFSNLEDHEQALPKNSIECSSNHDPPHYSNREGAIAAFHHQTSVHEQLEPDDPAPYNDMVSGLVYTVRTYGFWTLYHGLTPTLLGAVPKAGLRFGLFAWFCALLFPHEGATLSATTIYFLAGLGAGAIEALVIVTPVETIKTKCIQLNMDFLDGLREILINEGIRGVYHGLLATVLKQSSVRQTFYLSILSKVARGILPWKKSHPLFCPSFVKQFSLPESWTAIRVLFRVQTRGDARWTLRFEHVSVVCGRNASRHFLVVWKPAV